MYDIELKDDAAETIMAVILCWQRNKRNHKNR